MTHYLRHFSAATLLVCGVSLSACSSVPQDGVIATDLTGSMSQMWSNVFTGQLRRAPQPHYVFGASDATLNSPQLMQRVNQQASFIEQYVQPTPQQPHARQTYARKNTSSQNPWLRRGFAKHSLETYESFVPQKLAALPPQKETAPIPRPPRSQPVLEHSPAARDAYPPKATPKDPAIAQDWEAANKEIGDSLSYVKMGGGSKIADWQQCESQAGGYFLTTSTGFVVAPKFDSCMRTLGYKSEAEAEIELTANAN